MSDNQPSKIGRPRKYKGSDRVQRTISMSDTNWKLVDKIAEAEKRKAATAHRTGNHSRCLKQWPRPKVSRNDIVEFCVEHCIGNGGQE